ncbi:oxidoreductase-like protein [Xylariaceae sp. FL0594]|nr:oxidoreductase-like protein [Xylariaceae sp. FL0594]
MPPNIRPLMRVARLQSPSWRISPAQRAFASNGSGTGILPGGTPGESSEQAMPLGPYYESILNKPQPIPDTKPEEPPTSSPKSPRSSAATKKAAQKPKANGELAPSSSSNVPDSSASSSTPSISSSSLSSLPPSPPSSPSSSPPSAPQPSAEPASAQEKARIIFGSRLAGPAERADRLQAMRNRSTVIAGVLVPPKPEEPDNCCMSGCVNCVWDGYRDDMEEWASTTARAEAALQAERGKGPAGVMRNVEPVEGLSISSPQQMNVRPSSVNMPVSMDDDGGGSETNWTVTELKETAHSPISKNLWDEDLYKNIPVGIREFMKQEKKLKEKHEREGTFGA